MSETKKTAAELISEDKSTEQVVFEYSQKLSETCHNVSHKFLDVSQTAIERIGNAVADVAEVEMATGVLMAMLAGRDRVVALIDRTCKEDPRLKHIAQSMLDDYEVKFHDALQGTTFKHSEVKGMLEAMPKPKLLEDNSELVIRERNGSGQITKHTRIS